MFNIFGIEETIKNVYILSRKFITDKAVYNTRELKPFYLMFLRDHQPNQRILAESSISFVADDIGIWGKLNPFHDSNALLNDMHQESMVGEVYPIHEQEKHLQVIRLGYQYLTESCSPLKALFDLIIHTIFLRKTRKIGHHVSFGGSSSSSMGLIWISGHGDLDQENVAELLLHELTHHQLFIDERCHMHYNHAELSKPENFSTSAILNRPVA